MKDKKFNWENLFLGIFILPLVMNPFGYVIYELPKVSFLKIFISVVVLVLIYRLFKKGALRFYWNKYVYLLTGLWILSLLLSTIFSVAPLESFFGSYNRIQGFLTHIFYIIYFVITLHFFYKKENIGKALTFIVGISLITSLYAILQKFGIDFIPAYLKETYLDRSFSTFGHPNFLGQFLLFPIWICILNMSKKHKKQTVFYLTSFLILVTALIFTENRASMLGLAISVIVFLILKLHISKMLRVLFSVMAISALALFIIFVAPSVRSIQTRFIVWEKTPEIISEHIFIGSGLETFEQSFLKVSPPEIYKFEELGETADRAHNEILDIGVTQGLFGILIYIGVLVMLIAIVFKKNSLKYKDVNIAFFSLIAIIISKFFSFSLVDDWLVFLTILAILAIYNTKFIAYSLKRGVLSSLIAGLICVLIFFNLLHVYKTNAADLHYKKGMFMFLENELNESVTSMTTANSFNPYQDAIAFDTSTIFYLLGKESGNDDLLQTSLMFNEINGRFSNYDYFYLIGAARNLTLLEKFDEAEALYQQAMQLAPANPRLWRDWSEMYFFKEDYVKAVEKAEKYLEISPDYWRWKYELNEKTFEEQEEYRIFFKTNPGFWNIFKILAESYSQLGDIETAGYYGQFSP